jgi:hypothetical protein
LEVVVLNYVLGILMTLLSSLGWNPMPTALLMNAPFGNVLVLAVMLIGLAAVIAIALYARRRGCPFWLMLPLGILASPIVQAIVLLILLRMPVGQ